MKLTILSLPLIAMALPAFGGSAYVRKVKSIDQRVIRNPHPVNNSRRFEGCGPVAGASLLGYWQTQRGYRTMARSDHFNGSRHPSHTIKLFYRKANSRKAPAKSKWTDGKRYNQTYTTGTGLTRALRYFAKSANKYRGNKRKLKVKRMTMARSWKKRLSTMKKQLRRGNPVIMMIKNIPGCLRSSNNKTWGWHYVVATGYKDSNKNIYLLSGWRELPHTESSGYSVHKRVSQPNANFGHVRCTFNEIKKAKPGLYWIER